MKNVMNVEILLFLFIGYFLLGDSLSLGHLFKSELGKGVLFLIVLFFSSYNIIYGLISLMVVLVLQDNNTFALDELFNNNDYKSSMTAITETLSNYKKCNNGVCMESFKEYMGNKKGEACNSSSSICDMNFSYLDKSDPFHMEEKLIKPVTSEAFANTSSCEDAIGYNI
tara:strand:- start:316 stop:822 length:507 start_codon:yes stop_codon:yes gene_type:complete